MATQMSDGEGHANNDRDNDRSGNGSCRRRSERRTSFRTRRHTTIDTGLIPPAAGGSVLAGGLDQSDDDYHRQQQQSQQQQSQHYHDHANGPGQQALRSSTTAEVPRVNHMSFFCGLTAGIAQAGIFNPFDRALYLSLKNQVPFLRYENFQNPYLGFGQSVGHRALSGGLYYPLEQLFMTILPLEDDDTNGAMYNFLAGTSAGAVNAVVINPISAVKYKTWGRDVNRGMTTEIVSMLRKGGLRPFSNGLIPTILRDVTFGGCYTFLRLELQYIFEIPCQYQWTANFVAAALATIVSGPFNLARNVQYGTKSQYKADTVLEVFHTLGQELQARPNALAKLQHAQNRLRLGWGTLRVAVGMAFGHSVYDWLASALANGNAMGSRR